MALLATAQLTHLSSSGDTSEQYLTSEPQRRSPRSCKKACQARCSSAGAAKQVKAWRVHRRICRLVHIAAVRGFCFKRTACWQSERMTDLHTPRKEPHAHSLQWHRFLLYFCLVCDARKQHLHSYLENKHNIWGFHHRIFHKILFYSINLLLCRPPQSWTERSQQRVVEVTGQWIYFSVQDLPIPNPAFISLYSSVLEWGITFLQLGLPAVSHTVNWESTQPARFVLSGCFVLGCISWMECLSYLPAGITELAHGNVQCFCVDASGTDLGRANWS